MLVYKTDVSVIIESYRDRRDRLIEDPSTQEIEFLYHRKDKEVQDHISQEKLTINCTLEK